MLPKKILSIALVLLIAPVCTVAQSERDPVPGFPASRGQMAGRGGTSPARVPGMEDGAPPAPAAGEDSDVSKGGTEINVKNAEIAAVIRIFSKKTKRNYILDERVKGKVSIYLPGKVTEEESLKILDSVLALKGFTSVPVGENLWKIVPSKEAKQSTIPTLREGEDTAGSSVVTRIVNLKYVGADEIKEVVAQLISPDGLASGYAGTNALLLIDYEDNIQRIVEIINSLDVPFTNRDMTLIPVTNADAADIAKKLQEILGIDGEGKNTKSGEDGGMDLVRARLRENANASVPGQPGAISNLNVGNASKMGGSGDGGVQGGRGREPKLIADERTNSIIVIADDDTTARIRALVSQLDSPIDLSGFRFYVYRCQHANAEELAEVLSGLAGEGGGSSKSSSSSSSSRSSMDDEGGLGLNTNSRNRGGKTTSTQNRVSGQKRTPGRSRSENGNESAGVTSVSLGENLSITADKSTNSLIINSSKADYEKIKALLQQLDVKRRQVLVEAMILEVGVDDSLELGTDFLTSTGGKDGGIMGRSDFGPSGDSLASLLSNPTETSKFSVAAASAGTLTLPGGIKVPTQAILLTAAQSNSNVNVLSSPNILTTDNEQAEIVVGQNVPFLASTSTSDTNLNNTFNQIDRQDVGITLRLTPQISSQSFVTMQIFTEVSNVVAATLASSLGPTTTVRTSETTVIAKDGQMIVMGGLLSDDMSEASDGVPFLKDVPVLGHLFRTSSEAHRKTNLLIFITPRIVQDQFDARDTTLEKRDSLQGEINSRGIYPDRREVLESDRLDRVSEAEMYEGEKPTTIRGSENRTDNDSSARGEPSLSAPKVSHSTLSGNTGVIELKVAPKLPSIPGQKGGDKAKISKKAVGEVEAKASMKPIVTTPQKGGRYLVMELAEMKMGSDVPFSVDKKTFTFGIEIPADSSPNAQRFFQTGTRYSYKVKGEDTPVTPVGAFSSRDEAAHFFSDRQIPWYTLSPYEIMNLGSGPWVKKETNESSR